MGNFRWQVGGCGCDCAYNCNTGDPCFISVCEKKDIPDTINNWRIKYPKAGYTIQFVYSQGVETSFYFDGAVSNDALPLPVNINVNVIKGTVLSNGDLDVSLNYILDKMSYVPDNAPVYISSCSNLMATTKAFDGQKYFTITHQLDSKSLAKNGALPYSEIQNNAYFKLEEVDEEVSFLGGAWTSRIPVNEAYVAADVPDFSFSWADTYYSGEFYNEYNSLTFYAIPSPVSTGMTAHDGSYGMITSPWSPIGVFSRNAIKVSINESADIKRYYVSYTLQRGTTTYKAFAVVSSRIGYGGVDLFRTPPRMAFKIYKSIGDSSNTSYSVTAGYDNTRIVSENVSQLNFVPTTDARLIPNQRKLETTFTETGLYYNDLKQWAIAEIVSVGPRLLDNKLTITSIDEVEDIDEQTFLENASETNSLVIEDNIDNSGILKASGDFVECGAYSDAGTINPGTSGSAHIFTSPSRNRFLNSYFDEYVTASVDTNDNRAFFGYSMDISSTALTLVEGAVQCS